MSFHDLITHLFLMLNKILMSECTTVYLFIYYKTAWLLPSLGYYQLSCYKPPHAYFYVDIVFNPLGKE